MHGPLRETDQNHQYMPKKQVLWIELETGVGVVGEMWVVVQNLSFHLTLQFRAAPGRFSIFKNGIR